MNLVDFKVYTPSGEGGMISVNPENVCRIGDGIAAGTTFIKQSDGSSVDVFGLRSEVKDKLQKGY